MSDFLASIDQFLGSFTPEEQAVTRVVFQSLLEGRPIGLDAVARTLGEPAAAVEPVVARLLERGTMERDPSTGQLVGARGLSLTPTPHRLVLDGRPLHAFCAVDAVGIPAALGRDARVASRCHACGAPLGLTVTAGVVTDSSPGTVVIWAAERDLARSLHRYT